MKIYESSYAASNSKKRKQSKILEAITNMNVDDRRKGQIAKFNTSSINNIKLATSDLLNITSYKTKNNKSLAVPENVATNLYKNLGKNNFFNFMLQLDPSASLANKSQTSKEFMNKTVQFNKAVTRYLNSDKRFNYNYAPKAGLPDFQNLFNAVTKYSDIKKNGGHVISYDIESVGGTNSGGHQQLDFISEISASVNRINKDGSTEVVENINTLFGITDDEYNMFETRLKSLRNKPKENWTGRDNVMLHRFAMLSDENVKIEQKGFEHVITNTENAIEVKDTVDNALKGLQRQRSIGVAQENWVLNNSSAKDLVEARKNYVMKAKDLIFNGKSGKTQYDNFVALGHNSIDFDAPMLDIFTGSQGSYAPGQHLDTYSAIKWIEELFGQGNALAGLKGKDGKPLQTSYKFGTGTQDQLKSMFINELSDAVKLQAHNAKNDEQTLFDIFNNTDFGRGIVSKMNAANSRMSNKKSEHQFSDRPGLFLNSYTEGMSYSGGKGAMSFVYNPNSRNFKTFDGYEIDLNGNAKKAPLGFNQLGMRTNALYEHEIMDINLKEAGFDDWSSLFNSYGIQGDEKFFQEYAHLDTLKILKSKEYINKDVYKEVVGDNLMPESNIIFSIVSNEEQLASLMGLKVGHINGDGSADFIKDRLDSLELQKTVLKKDGTIEVKNIDSSEAGKALMERSITKTHIDSGAREARNFDYGKAQRLREYNLANNISFSDRVSQLVSQNGKLDLSLVQELTEEIGWEDFNTGQNMLVSETIAKNVVLDKHVKNMEPILGPLSEMFEKDGAMPSVVVKDNYGRKIVKPNTDLSSTEKERRNFIYRNVVNDVLEEIAVNDNVMNKAAYINNSKPTISSKRDLNRIDFYLDDLFPELENNRMGTTLGNQSTDIFQLDLNKNDSLLNAFRPKIYGKDVKNIKQGKDDIHVLKEAYKRIGSDARFEGVWGDLSLDALEKYSSSGQQVSVLNDLMNSKLQNFINDKRGTQGNSGYGLLFPRYAQNPIDSIRALEYIDPKTLNEMVSKSFNKHKQAKFYTSKEGKTNDSIIDEIVDRYFVPFTKDDLENQIKDMSDYQKKIARSQYQVARRDSRTRAAELINASSVGQTDISLYDKGKNAKLFLSSGAEQIEVNPYRYSLNNGVIDLDINGNIYSNLFAFDSSSYVRNGKVVTQNSFNLDKNLKFSNIGEATSNKAYNLTASVTHAIKNDKDPLAAIKRNISTMNMSVAEKTSYRLNDNIGEIALRSTQLDINDIMPILPELDAMGIFSSIEGYNDIAPEYRSGMRDIINKIKESRISGVADGLLAGEKNIFFQLYQPYIVNEIQKRYGVQDIEGAEEILKHASNNVKDTQFVKGRMSISDRPYGHALGKFSKEERPPAYQYGNYHTYDRQQFFKSKGKHTKDKNDLNYDLYKNVMIDDATTTSYSDKFLRNKNLTNGVTLKYAELDSFALNDILNEGLDIESVKKGKNSKLADFVSERFGDMSYDEAKVTAQQIADAALGMSTFEQENVMNSRIAYDYFHKSEVQKIKAKKGLMIDHKNNLENIDSVKNNLSKIYPVISEDGEIKYELGTKVQRGDLIGTFGLKETDKYAKKSGVVRSRYYKGNTLVSEKELNNFINAKNLKGEDQIIEALNNEFDLVYELIGKTQSHGQKTFTGTSEKATTYSPDFAVGKIDKTLAQELKNVGHGDAVGKVLTREYTDYLYEDIKRTYGESRANGIISKIDKERHIVSDSIVGLVDSLKDVGVVSSFETPKHKSTDLGIEHIFNKIRYSNYSPEEKEQMYNALTDGKALFPKGPNGVVDVSNVDNINSNINSDFIDEATKEKLSTLMRDIEVLTTPDGKAVGYKAYGHVGHMHDDDAGTASSFMDVLSYKKEMSEISKKLSNETLDQVERDNLAKRYQYIERAFNKSEIEKGIKYSNEMHNILNRKVYENEEISGLIKSLKDANLEEDVDNLLGNLNKGKHSSYAGKSIMEPVTSEMLSFLKAEPGELLLDNAKGAKYDYLKNAFKKGSGLSVDKADLAYSINQGMAAMQFNRNLEFGEDGFKNKVQVSDMLELTEGSSNEHANFKKVDLWNADFSDPYQTLALDLGQQGDQVLNEANNPYSNNLLIKFGEGENDYLAIGKMPVKTFDDSITKKDHIAKLSLLQNAIGDYKKIDEFDTQGRADQVERIRGIVSQIKDSQKHDVTAKKQLIGQFMSPRLTQSFYGKAAGMNIYEGAESGFENINRSAESMAKRLETITNRNSSIYNNQMIGGKSYLEHIAEGKYFDKMDMSEEAFEYLGYFDRKTMEERFSSMTKDKKYSHIYKALESGNATDEMLREGMKDILATKGDAFVLTRYPELQIGSNSPVLGFLNQDLKGNEIVTPGYTAEKRKLDFDGDKLAVARLKNKDNKSYLDYVTGVDTSKELKAQTDAIMNYMTIESMTTNQYWQDKTRQRITGKERAANLLGKVQEDGTIKGIINEDGTVNGTMLDALSSDRNIDGHIFSNLVIGPDMSTEDHQKNLNKYRNYVGTASVDGNHSKAIEMLKTDFGDKYDSALSEYREAFRFQKYLDATVAKSSKPAIGEINITTNKIKDAFLSLADRSDSNFNLQSQLLYDFGHLSEEAAISAKSSIKGLDPDRASKWNKMSLDLVTGRGNKDELVKGMKDWTKEYVIDDIDFDAYAYNSTFRKELGALTGITVETAEQAKAMLRKKDIKNKAKDYAVNNYIDMISSLRDQENVGKMISQLSLGKSTTGVIKGTENIVTTSYENKFSILSDLLQNIKATPLETNFIKDDGKIVKDNFSKMSESSKIFEKNTTSKMAKDVIIDGAEEIFANGKGKGMVGTLALGAIAVGAAFMGAGYVGGRPRPADVQAMEEAQAGQEGGNGFLMADPGVNFQGNSGGYVININANTKQDREKAAQAIQQVIANRTNATVNMSMNIQENYGNIINRDLERAIEDALD